MKLPKLLPIIILLYTTLFIPISFSDHYMHWGLPEGAKMRIGKGGITGNIAFSPDSSQLVVASSVGVWIYDVNTGNELNLLTRDSVNIKSVAISPDGTTVASGGPDGTLSLWDIATGNSKFHFLGHSGEILGLAFSPNSRLLASCGGNNDKTICLWDTNTAELKNTFIGHTEDVLSVAFSPDGKTLASGAYDDLGVKLWDVATGELIATFHGHKDTINSVVFSPDGKMLASCDGYFLSLENVILIWDVENLELKASFRGHTSRINSISFSPDGRRLVSGCQDGTVVLWDVATPSYITTFLDHTDNVNSVAFSADGKLIASSSWDGTIKIRDSITYQVKTTITGHSLGYTDIAISPDASKIVAGSWDNNVRLWDSLTGKITHILYGHIDNVESVTFSPDGQTVASSGYFYDSTVRLWDTETGIYKNSLYGHNRGADIITFSHDGKMVATSDWEGKICVWDANSGSHLATFRDEYKMISSLAFSPDARTLVSGGNSVIRLWDLENRRLKYVKDEPSGRVNTLTFSPDGKTLVSGSRYGEIILWNMATGQPNYKYNTNGPTLLSVRFSPDGSILVGAALSKDRSIHLFDPITGEVKMKCPGHSEAVSVAFSADGTRLTTADENGTILMWDISSIFYPTKYKMDVNRDSIVDLHDLVVVALNFGQTGPNTADVNNDGVVNIEDLILVAAAFESNVAASPSQTKQILKSIKIQHIQQWLTQAQQLNLTDASSQKGILFLEKLLVTLAPQETTLLPNYPNPFNPETWIPYQLAQQTDVTIHIYSPNGQLIRTLELGHKPAGIYQQSNRAAYWDGKNEFGEPVASGVYFYQLSTAKFSATRRMVIRK